MTFSSPSGWFLLLLLLVPALAWWRRRRRIAVAFASTERARAVGATWAVRLRAIVPALRVTALVLLVVCLARPQKLDERTRVFTEGIAIELLIDRSGSMEAEDFRLRGRRVTRLAAVKDVVQRFVRGGDGLPGRGNDLVGLIVFGTYADSACPLTLDHDHVVRAVQETRIPRIEAEKATAIGDALALGVERMRGLEERRHLDTDRRIRSKVMILLTDGENTAGNIDPMTAAEMAAAFDIRVYTIGAGTEGGAIPAGPLGLRRPVGIDEQTLREIAAATGGQYFRATDSASLERIYAQIDALERTGIEQQRFRDYQEYSVQALPFAGVTLPPLLAVVLGLLLLETVLAHTRFRRLA